MGTPANKAEVRLGTDPANLTAINADHGLASTAFENLLTYATSVDSDGHDIEITAGQTVANASFTARWAGPVERAIGFVGPGHLYHVEVYPEGPGAGKLKLSGQALLGMGLRVAAGAPVRADITLSFTGAVAGAR